MSVEQAIHERWAHYGPLLQLVPACKVFTGQAPERVTDNGDGSMSVERLVDLPYVTLERQGDSQVTRSNTGAIFSTVMLRFSAWGQTLAQAKQIAHEILSYFNRAAFSYSLGSVGDCKQTNHVEQQEQDGTWHVMLDFQIREMQTG